MMRSYENVLRDMLNDVKANVVEAQQRGAIWNQTINDVNGELAASGREMAGIKRTFSIKQLFKTKRRSGISAEEARTVANTYCKYADIVDRIADEQWRLEDAKMSLSKAESDVQKRQNVQQKVEDLLDALGLIE